MAPSCRPIQTLKIQTTKARHIGTCLDAVITEMRKLRALREQPQAAGTLRKQGPAICGWPAALTWEPPADQPKKPMREVCLWPTG